MWSETIINVLICLGTKAARKREIISNLHAARALETRAWNGFIYSFILLPLLVECGVSLGGWNTVSRSNLGWGSCSHVLKSGRISIHAHMALQCTTLFSRLTFSRQLCLHGNIQNKHNTIFMVMPRYHNTDGQGEQTLMGEIVSSLVPHI